MQNTAKSQPGAQHQQPSPAIMMASSSTWSSLQPVLLALLLTAISSVAAGRHSPPPTVSFSITKRSSKSGITLSQNAYYADNGTYVGLLGPDPSQNSAGGAFRTKPVAFLDPFTNKPASFSTSFTFAIQAPENLATGDGLAFVIKPTPAASSSNQGEYLGLFDPSQYSNGDPAIQTVAVEIDTYQNGDVDDQTVPHIGLDINSIVSAVSADASAFVADGPDTPQKATVWVDYNARSLDLVVFAAKAPALKSHATRLFSYKALNLTSIINPLSYVGFTAASGDAAEDNFVHSWSFKTSF